MSTQTDKRQVQIERYVEQVVDGLHYKGHVNIEKARFEYEFKFSVPIPKLDSAPRPDTFDAFKKLFQLSIKKSAGAIDLEQSEYATFIQMLLPHILDFYNNPQTRGSNEGSMGEMVRGEGVMPMFGASLAIGMTSNIKGAFPVEFCKVLNGEKFACGITID